MMSTKIARLGLGVPGLGVSGPSPRIFKPAFFSSGNAASLAHFILS